ncbi:MAG: helix-turn-helix domain-containing protein [Verrucomicrobiae bacterium]|nr:helix-turn-helix domain-containing protein [Verrucomicrobiae bacterium]NNJ43819.1 helix-turn-helix domain-containing protein [Akkermansiaceae bacterium]
MDSPTIQTGTHGPDLIENLKRSPFYQACQNAFRDATDLPLTVISAQHSAFNPCHSSPHRNPFCQGINASHGTCRECIREQEHLLSHAEKKAYTHTCFAGLTETAVPLRLGHQTIGFLKTGQILIHQMSSEHVALLRQKIAASGYSEAELDHLFEQYKQTPVFGETKYEAIITLLSVISLQLTELLNRILLESKTNEPDIIRKAKELIADRIDERISLGEISDQVHVSVFYFCKLFKQSTGMTFTEYVNRQRIELAKGELKNTEKPVTEISYSVGFQSLSQFNRCFLKYAGEAPREYRQHSRSSLSLDS